MTSVFKLHPTGGCLVTPNNQPSSPTRSNTAVTNTTCLLCDEELYLNVNNDWFGSEWGDQHCYDLDNDCPTTTKHDPDLCSDGTPEHNWVGGDEQMCSECGSVRTDPNNVMPVNNPNPHAPSNPAIIERFGELMEKRKMEMEARKTRTYRESMGDMFQGMRFQGGEDPDPTKCEGCGIQFDDEDLKSYHDQQVHGIGVKEDEDEDEDDA